MHGRMTMDDLIEALESIPNDKQIVFDFCSVAPTTIDSSRGFYNNPALGWAPTGHSGKHHPPSAEQLADHLRTAIGRTFEGWKGGDYVYTGTEPLWVDNSGDWNSTYITDIQTDGYYAVLITERED